MRSETEELRAILLACESTEQFDAPIQDVNQKNCCGDTPLHMVVHWGEIESARSLIAAGADLNAQGERGFTPLFYARTVEMARLLLNSGANPRIFGDEGKLAPDEYIRLLDVVDVANFLARARTSK